MQRSPFPNELARANNDAPILSRAPTMTISELINRSISERRDNELCRYNFNTHSLTFFCLLSAGVELYNQNPEAFTEKYGTAAAEITKTIDGY